MIDPYELLGVTPASTAKEVKRAYYDLCLLLHPDKGGSAEDMAVLQRAYEQVAGDLAKTELKYTGDFPTFINIFDACMFDTRAFNRQFEIESNANVGEWLCPASIPEGHGAWLADESIGKENTNGDELVKYVEPLAQPTDPATDVNVTVSLNNCTDFTVNLIPLKMGDCKGVYLTQDACNDTRLHRTLEELIAERDDTT